MRRAVRAASIITALSCTPAWADNPTLLEKYKEWSAFAASGTPKVCFALAQPKQSTPKGIKRGPVYFYISHWPADGVTNEVSVKMGYPFGPGAKATATVGSAKFDLFTKDEGAFVEKVDDRVGPGRGDEEGQHPEDRRQVCPRHRNERHLFARRVERRARPHRQGMFELTPR